MTNENVNKEAPQSDKSAPQDSTETKAVDSPAQVKTDAVVEETIDKEAEERRNMLRELRANQKSGGGGGLAARRVSGGDDSSGGGDRKALRNLLAKRRAAGDGGAEAGGGQGRGQLLKMLVKRRRGQDGDGPSVDENSSPDEIAEQRERLESRAERLERALKGVLAEIDEMRDLERRVAAGGSDDSGDQ